MRFDIYRNEEALSTIFIMIGVKNFLIFGFGFNFEQDDKEIGICLFNCVFNFDFSGR